MKKFEFRLDRVLAWRSTEARLEERKLEQLRAEARFMESEQTRLRADASESAAAVLAVDSITGAELAALAAFREGAAKRVKILEQKRAQHQGRIAAQIQAVLVRRRAVRLLERLKQRQRAAWNLEYERELARNAGEVYLARWNRDDRRADSVERPASVRAANDAK